MHQIVSYGSILENIFPGNSSWVRGWCWGRDSTPTLGTAFEGEMLQSLPLSINFSKFTLEHFVVYRSIPMGENQGTPKF